MRYVDLAKCCIFLEEAIAMLEQKMHNLGGRNKLSGPERKK